MESKFIDSGFSVSHYFEDYDSHKEDEKRKKFNIVIASVTASYNLEYLMFGVVSPNLGGGIIFE
jgi:hypothetical protein